MVYRIKWRKRAERQLAETWLASADRNGLTASIHRLETTLGLMPRAVGEWLLGNRRHWFFENYHVIYDVIEDDMLVRIVRFTSL